MKNTTACLLVASAALFILFNGCTRNLAANSPATAESQALSNDLLNRGVAHAIEGEFQNAISDFSKVLENDPANGFCYYHRALIWSRIGNFDRALADLDNALAIQPENASAYTERAIVLVKTGKYEQASSDFARALDLNPLNEKAYNGRGVLRAKTEAYDLAIADFSKAIDLNPEYDMPYNNRAIVWTHTKDYNRAMQDYTTSLRIVFGRPGNDLHLADRIGRKVHQNILVIALRGKRLSVHEHSGFISSDHQSSLVVNHHGWCIF